MAAIRPRLSVVLDPKVYEVLQRASAMQRRSMSSIASDLLSDASPVLDRVLNVCESLQDAAKRPNAYTEYVAQLERFQTAIESAIAETSGQLDLVSMANRKVATPGSDASTAVAPVRLRGTRSDPSTRGKAKAKAKGKG